MVVRSPWLPAIAPTPPSGLVVLPSPHLTPASHTSFLGPPRPGPLAPACCSLCLIPTHPLTLQLSSRTPLPSRRPGQRPALGTGFPGPEAPSSSQPAAGHRGTEFVSQCRWQAGRSSASVGPRRGQDQGLGTLTVEIGAPSPQIDVQACAWLPDQEACASVNKPEACEHAVACRDVIGGAGPGGSLRRPDKTHLDGSPAWPRRGIV